MGENTGCWLIFVVGILAFAALLIGPALLGASQMANCIDHGGSWISGNCLMPAAPNHEAGK